MNLTLGQRAKIADLVPNGQRFTLGVAVNAPGMISISPVLAWMARVSFPMIAT